MRVARDTTATMPERWSRCISVLLGVAVSVLILVYLSRDHHYFYDDAYITLRYAKHLAQGWGPRWNLAGPPVEGFTSPLHVFLLALLLKFHIGIITAPRLISFLVHGMLVLWVWRWCRPRYGSLGATLAAAGTAASFALLFWDLAGLEAVLFASLCTCATLAMLSYTENDDKRWLIAGSVLWGLAGLTRLDGVVPALYTAAYVAVCCRNDRRKLFAVVGIFTLCIVAALLPYQVFRMLYFHDVLPNTYYAKVYGIPRSYLVGAGRHYLHLFAVTTPYALPILLLVAAVQVVRRSVPARSLFLLGWITVVIAFVVWNGGDHMYGFRFMATVIPMLYVTTVQGLFSLQWLQKPGGAAMAAIGLSLLLVSQFQTDILNQPTGDLTSLGGRVVGDYVNRWFPTGASVALNAAGALPFAADNLTYIDMLGLNDHEIARRNPVPVKGDWIQRLGHLKADGQSVLRRNPDVIILRPAAGRPVTPGVIPYLSDKEIEDSPTFQNGYVLCRVKLQPTPDQKADLRRFGIVTDQFFSYYSRRGHGCFGS